MLCEIRTGADFFKWQTWKKIVRSATETSSICSWNRSRRAALSGPHLLQRFELFGGNTCRTQVADRGSRRTGETRKLSNRREIW